MNSPHPCRRNMYIELEPKEDIKHVAIELKILLGQWDYYLGSEWWVTHAQCKQCKSRQEHEISKFIMGEWVWDRKYCMRHYLVFHLNELLSSENIESNRPIEFSISKQQITIKISTNNYDYDVTIFRPHAILICNYKGTKYTFTYNNHTNSLPYSNTYFMLLRAVCSFANELQRFLAHLPEQSRVMYNVYINNALYVSP